MLLACYDLYPTKSNYYQTVANAWASTGVGDIFVLGDSNGNGVLNIQDIIMIIQFVLGNIELSDFQIFTVDANQDENIDLLDVVQAINSLLNG